MHESRERRKKAETTVAGFNAAYWISLAFFFLIRAGVSVVYGDPFGFTLKAVDIALMVSTIIAFRIICDKHPQRLRAQAVIDNWTSYSFPSPVEMPVEGLEIGHVTVNLVDSCPTN